jgi:hypothetical protein
MLRKSISVSEPDLLPLLSLGGSSSEIDPSALRMPSMSEGEGSMHGSCKDALLGSWSIGCKELKMLSIEGEAVSSLTGSSGMEAPRKNAGLPLLVPPRRSPVVCIRLCLLFPPFVVTGACNSGSSGISSIFGRFPRLKPSLAESPSVSGFGHEFGTPFPFKKLNERVGSSENTGAGALCGVNE